MKYQYEIEQMNKYIIKKSDLQLVKMNIITADIWNHVSLQMIGIVSDLFIDSTDGLCLYLFLCDNYK